MAEIKWGAPLTGAQMKLLLAAGLPISDRVEWSGDDYTVGSLSFAGQFYRLPADHPAYKLLEKGWLDGRNVRLWFGGNKAPDDWLEGSSVLLRDGYTGIGTIWEHKHGFEDIIAYIRKAEHREETTKACQSFDDTVTLNKMTEAEWSQRFGLGDSDVATKLVLDRLGLIKPEPTREERFWAKFPMSNSLKESVRLTLEFERD